MRITCRPRPCDLIRVVHAAVVGLLMVQGLAWPPMKWLCMSRIHFVWQVLIEGHTQVHDVGERVKARRDFAPSRSAMTP